MEPHPTSIVEADLTRAEHAAAVVALTDAYASDPLGNGQPLPPEVRARLIAGLRSLPTTFVLLAYRGERAVGIATCFWGFSTFSARPLLNIHDLAVLPAYRGLGVGRALLAAVERAARARGCVRLTLEVLANNEVAKNLYQAVGFAQAVYDPKAGGALFYAKALS